MRRSVFVTILILSLTVPAFSNLNSPEANFDNNSFYAVKLPDDVQIDSIAVHKQSHEMLVFSNNRLMKIYRVHLGLNPKGCKQVCGDYKTPEGLYRITYRNLFSQFHKSMGISYPGP